MSRRQKIALASGLILAVLVIPIPYLASPEWTIRVTDEAGNPLSGMLVRLDSENFSAENTFHEVDLYTDANGSVTFPAKRRVASVLSRCYFTTLSALAVAHASFGPSAYVNVFGKGREGSAISNGVLYFWSGHPDRVNSSIVAKQIRQ